MNKKLIVIGGGPAGHTAALEAAGSGMDVILIEKNRIGGTCLNKGCVPTKIYLQAIKANEQNTRFNLCPDDYDKDSFIEKLKEIRDDVISRLNYGSIFAAERKGVEIVEGTAQIVGDKKVEIKCNDGTIYEEECDYVLMATGSGNREFHLGDDYIIHNLDDIVMLENLPSEISIIGAGILGVEIAVILAYLGVKVHLIEAKSSILPLWDEEISSQMAYYLQERGIKVVTESSKPECRDVVFCCGREVPGEIIDYKITTNFYKKNEWLYYAGDCISGIKDASVAIQQGRSAVEHIMGTKTDNREIHVPHCIYTPLEASMTGKTEIQLQKEGVEYESFFHSMVFTAVGMIDDLSQGLIKVLAEKHTGKLLGFHIMSPHATEMIMTCHMALECRMTAKEFCDIVFPHPTESEQLKEAVLGLVERVNEI